MARLLLILLLLVSTSAAARMYQWQNPSTGSVQFAGVPPAWYRSPEGGPRVLVFESGKLVDDTAIELAPNENQEMREAAFRDLEQRQQQEAIKRLERAAFREAARRAEAERQTEQPDAGLESQTTEAPPEVLPESLDAAMVDRLKSIISDYDRAHGASMPPEETRGLGPVPGTY
jgi:hypothetical protein